MRILIDFFIKSIRGSLILQGQNKALEHLHHNDSLVAAFYSLVQVRQIGPLQSLTPTQWKEMK